MLSIRIYFISTFILLLSSINGRPIFEDRGWLNYKTFPWARSTSNPWEISNTRDSRTTNVLDTWTLDPWDRWTLDPWDIWTPDLWDKRRSEPRNRWSPDLWDRRTFDPWDRLTFEPWGIRTFDPWDWWTTEPWNRRNTFNWDKYTVQTTDSPAWKRRTPAERDIYTLPTDDVSVSPLYPYRNSNNTLSIVITIFCLTILMVFSIIIKYKTKDMCYHHHTSEQAYAPIVHTPQRHTRMRNTSPVTIHSVSSNRVRTTHAGECRHGFVNFASASMISELHNQNDCPPDYFTVIRSGTAIDTFPKVHGIPDSPPPKYNESNPSRY